MSNSVRRTYPEAFKKQVVALYQGGKSRKTIIEEYDVTSSTFDKWPLQFESSGSFKEKDNLTPEQRELKKLRKNLFIISEICYNQDKKGFNDK